MDSLNHFLERITSILNTGAASKKKILEVIKNITSIELSEKEFELKDSVINIYSSPLVKNQIFMHKQMILKELKNQQILDITDIR